MLQQTEPTSVQQASRESPDGGHWHIAQPLSSPLPPSPAGQHAAAASYLKQVQDVHCLRGFICLCCRLCTCRRHQLPICSALAALCCPAAFPAQDAHECLAVDSMRMAAAAAGHSCQLLQAATCLEMSLQQDRQALRDASLPAQHGSSGPCWHPQSAEAQVQTKAWLLAGMKLALSAG